MYRSTEGGRDDWSNDGRDLEDMWISRWHLVVDGRDLFEGIASQSSLSVHNSIESRRYRGSACPRVNVELYLLAQRLLDVDACARCGIAHDDNTKLCR